MNEQIRNINWYPGHMKKTGELIKENLKLVDLVIEVTDARIPVSSRNPIIDELVAGKDRLIVLNKSDLSDEAENEKWAQHFRANGSKAVIMNCNSGAGAAKLLKILSEIQDEKNSERVRKKPLRMMIVGVPNVGKSSLINRLTGRKSAKTGDKPGVTRGKQWLALENDMQLLDTPGILWPKFEDPGVGLNLAFCGSIKDEILPLQELCLELLDVLRKDYPKLLIDRYKLSQKDFDDFGLSAENGIDFEEGGDEAFDEDGRPLNTRPALTLMELIAKKRGFILAGKRTDYERCAKTLLDEFRSGAIGHITLERSI